MMQPGQSDTVERGNCVRCVLCGKVRPYEGPVCPLCGSDDLELEEERVAEWEWVY